MSLPKRLWLKVGGSYWTVILGEKHIISEGGDRRCCGITRPSQKEIEVSEGEDIVDTLLHELCHAIQYVTGHYSNNEDDEGWEEAAAHAIRAFMMDNKEFVRALLDAI